ncbi:MAG: FAD-dependent oxidoreductase [Phenylobacterium sp.]|nr:FAD-dependent oxidoreductase [Phenylobacterium sp.]
MSQTDVLIVGAGPTGLVLALWLTKLGVRVRIIDKTTEPGTTSRALAVHARTLELYRQLDLADEVVARGHKVPAISLWVKGKRVTGITFAEMGADLTPYPFLHIFPQDEHERLLIAHLEAMGVTVERRTELVGFRDSADQVTAELRGPDGQVETVEARFIAGCDGTRSTVREALEADFPGGTYRDLFYVADIEGAGPPVNGELHAALDEADFLAVFPLAGEGRARLIGTVRDERAEHPETLRFEDVSHQAMERLKLQVLKVNWFSTYHVHHRVTDRFREGRAFLLGDAAHVHSPAGGQGMNTGIGDAINLAWKLQAVLAGRAPDSLPDSYQEERIAFARRLVATTDRVFSFVTADGKLAEVLRTRIAPHLAPKIIGLERVRDYIFRTVSQVTLNYRHSALSRGAAGQVHGGDRLPWVRIGEADNYASLAEPVWQVHVYGEARPELAGWCATRGVALHVLAWTDAHQAAGLRKDAAYLLRPDTYVAVADADASGQTFADYASGLGIALS